MLWPMHFFFDLMLYKDVTSVRISKAELIWNSEEQKTVNFQGH